MSFSAFFFDILDTVSNVSLYGPFSGITDTRIYYFTFNSWGNRPAIWAEGIGSLMFFTWPCAFDSEFTSCNLIGFCTGDTLWSPWDNGNVCNLTVGIEPEYERSGAIEAYWDGNSILVSSSEAEIGELRLLDLTGREVCRQVYDNAQKKILFSNIPAHTTGIHILQIRINGVYRSQLIPINRTP